MKLKRKTRMLKRAATESLALAVELFNRPSETAREESVLLLLGHAFEMLLKAAVYQQRGRIRDPGDRYTYEFTKTLNVAHSELGVVSDDDLTVLRAIQQDRNAAAHDTVAMSDDLLYLHTRSAVTIFGKILRDQFTERLTDVLPGRAVPVSAMPPTDALAVVDREMIDITAFLAPNTRRGEEARSRIRPLLALDGSATGREDPPTEREVDRAVGALRAGRPWQSIFPGLAQISVSDAPTPGSTEITLRVVRSGVGVPVRRATPEEADSALIYRTSDPFQEFNIGLSRFGPLLGLTRQQGLALVWHLNLKNDERAYFLRTTANGGVIYQGMSARAVHLARQAMAEPQFDIDAITKAYNRRNSARSTRRCTT